MKTFWATFRHALLVQRWPVLSVEAQSAAHSKQLTAADEQYRQWQQTEAADVRALSAELRKPKG